MMLLEIPWVENAIRNKKKNASCWENCSHGHMSRIRSRTAISFAKVLMKGSALILDINYDSALKLLRSIRIISIKTYSVTSFYYRIFFIFSFIALLRRLSTCPLSYNYFLAFLCFFFNPEKTNLLEKEKVKEKVKGKERNKEKKKQFVCNHIW